MLIHQFWTGQGTRLENLQTAPSRNNNSRTWTHLDYTCQLTKVEGWY